MLRLILIFLMGIQAASAQVEEDSPGRDEVVQHKPQRPAVGAGPMIVLPPRLPARCITSTAIDYQLPPIFMLSIIKVESSGRSVIGRNKNGSLDIGVAQHNTRSWVPYFKKHYGIEPQSLLDNPCQSIRAQGYALRYELNSKECGGRDLWCAVGRYHSPGNFELRKIYVAKVSSAMRKMLGSGKF